MDEAEEFVAPVREAGLAAALLIAPTTPPHRAAQIARASSGFIYLLARTGITGERSDAPEVGMRISAVREVTGVGAWFREKITAFDRPRSFSYLILRSFPPMHHDGGTLTFTPAGDGTHVDWVSSYSHPALAGGRALEAVTSRLLTSSFQAVLARCAKVLET